jgi:diacylglycerol kinase
MAGDTKQGLKRSIKVLKFLLSLDDVELIKSTIEQVIDNLEDEESKRSEKLINK